MNTLKILAKKILSINFGSILSVDTDEKVASLTFDDGPDPIFTPKLLDILSRYEAKSTFFVVGEAVKEAPLILQRMVQEGHEIANHTYDHPSLPTISKSSFDIQIQQTQDLLKPAAPAIMRPPHGHQTPRTQFYTWLNGYKAIFWSIDPRDWECDDSVALAEKILNEVSPGAIVLLHDRLASTNDDLFFNRQPTLEAVQEVLRSLQDYKFVTISELLTYGKPKRGVRWNSGL